MDMSPPCPREIFGLSNYTQVYYGQHFSEKYLDRKSHQLEVPLVAHFYWLINPIYVPGTQLKVNSSPSFLYQTYPALKLPFIVIPVGFLLVWTRALQ